MNFTFAFLLLLVNGNTRAAALLQLSHIDAAKGIDVAVLPNDIVEEDIIELEMFLQMNKRTHQKYTFTNELLFMKRFLDLGKTHKEVAASCGFKARGEAKVRTKMRLLDLIDHTREMSNNKSLSYEVFDRKEEHLADLDRKMEKDKKDGIWIYYRFDGAEHFRVFYRDGVRIRTKFSSSASVY